MCRSKSCVKCGRSLVVAPCDMWGRCVLLRWQWRVISVLILVSVVDFSLSWQW